MRVKKAVTITGLIITVFIVLVYLLSAMSAYISPVRFSAGSIFSLAFLPVLLVYLLLTITWFFIRKRIALLLVILLFAGYKNLGSTIGLNVFHSSWKWEKDSSSIRIMCWNVDFMGNPFIRFDSASSIRRQSLNYIREMDPDILCLQDFSTVEEGTAKNVFFNNLDSVMKAGNFSHYYFPYIYTYNGKNYSDRYGVIIFSKLPITDTGSFNINSGILEEKAGYADVMMHNKPVRLYAAHLSSMALWPNKTGEAGLNYIEGDSLKKRTTTILSKLAYFGKIHATESELIKKQMNKSPYPVLFCGDLNSVPSSYVYHHLKTGLKDAFLEKDFGVGGTYNMVFPKLRIDVLFHSTELEVVQYTRPVVNLSDHYPIIADIRWKK